LVSERRDFRIPASSKRGYTVDAAFDGETRAMLAHNSRHPRSKDQPSKPCGSGCTAYCAG